MSQKSSQGNKNTLFNYFSRSPVVNKINKSVTENISPVPSSKITDEKTLHSIQIVDRVDFASTKRKLSSSTESRVFKDDDDKQINPTKKRRRILCLESDSEEENEDGIKNQNKKEMDDCLEQNESPAGSKNSFVFHDKLKKLEKEEISNEVQDSVIKTQQSTSNLDDVVIWPHNKFEFLKPENIKDKKGRRPSHPDYDPRTLYVPEKFLNGLTPGMRQWWELKSNNFDCVLFFKLGKFYEFYHMDADIVVNELGFIYMKGEYAHSGFPEISYDKMAKTLVERGYKIARVEQTETPDMMTERCKKQKVTSKFDKVVKREICQVTTKGTQIYGAQTEVTCNYQPNYMLSIVEKDHGTFSTFGVCFIETTIGDFHIAEFEDDKNCSRLLTLLSHYHPALVLLEKRGIALRTETILKTILSGVLRETLTPGTEFWGAEKTLKYLAENYFKSNEEKEWPETLKLMQNPSDHLGLTPHENYKLALKALGGCIWFLKQSLLEEQILSMARFKMYFPSDIKSIPLCKENGLDSKQQISNEIMRRNLCNQYMVLDSIAINNLRILGEEYSLFSTLDRCCTKFGKRLLHHWVCSPSCNVNIIKERQAAISELIDNPIVLKEARELFSNLPDFERNLAQIHGFGNPMYHSKNHPNGRAILFEEKIYNKKKLQNLLLVLKGFHTLLKIPSMFSDFESQLIQQLTQFEPKGMFPKMEEILTFFQTAFDHNEALKEGVIAPKRGIDPEFDAIEKEIDEINQELKDYLRDQEKYFGCRLSYFGQDKKRFQIEVPENHARKANDSYFLESQRKGSKPVRRFHTDETKEFLRRIMYAEEQRNNALKDLSRRIYEKFSNYYVVWKNCIDSVATLDVLGSLAEYAKTQNQICIPEICEESKMPFLYLENGFHPCMISSDNYIPNGISLGGHDNSPLILLTGPNMGGKSTLMRQIGLLTIMVQIGCHIPAQSCKMSLVDRIFTRLGAQDDILAGHSTFLVELKETSSILKHSTLHSLVLLDELGRGTATYDGTAIAASVVDFMADIKCRTLFSTHYHHLVDHFENDARISFGHMACMVEDDLIDDPTQETVTFLYKLTSGASPKSYGFNAAKLAGMPLSVIRKAYQLSKNVEYEAAKRKMISQILLNENIGQIKDLLIKIKSYKVM